MKRSAPGFASLAPAILAAVALLAPGIAVAAPPGELARLVTPTPRTLPYGATPVVIDVPEGVEVVVEREIGPERWQRLDPDASGARAFDAGTDFGPEVVRVTSYKRDESGVRVAMGSSVVETAFFPPPLVEVKPDPGVDVLVRPVTAEGRQRLARGLATADLRCEYGGLPCSIRAVDPAGEGTLYVSLLVDVSGSLCSYGPRLADSLGGFVREVGAAGLDVRFRVVEFAERRTVRLDPIEVLGWSRDRDLFRYESDLGRVRELLQGMACGGMTSLWESIERELHDVDVKRGESRLHDEDALFAIVVVTDGRNTSGNVDFDWLAASVGPMGIPLFPLLVGPNPNPRVSALGAQSGGIAFRDARDLAPALLEIGAALARRYRVAFRPANAYAGSKSARALEIAGDGLEVSHPRIWSNEFSQLEIARRVLRSRTADATVLAPAVDAVRRLGDARDAERVYERFLALLEDLRRQRKARWDKGARLEDVERQLGVIRDHEYLAFRSRVFFSVFAATARALLHASNDPREQRRGAELLERLEAFVEGERYSIGHVMDPVLDAFFDPEFPADERARRILEAVHQRRADVESRLRSDRARRAALLPPCWEARDPAVRPRPPEGSSVAWLVARSAWPPAFSSAARSASSATPR